MAVAEKVRHGMDEAEARRQARIELGHPEEARERLREGRAGSLLEALRQDAVYAASHAAQASGVLRALRADHRPGRGREHRALRAWWAQCVLQPLPFPEPDSLVRIFDTNREAGIERTGATTGNLADWRRRARLFAGIAGYYTMGRTLTGDAGSEVVLSAQVSEDFFPCWAIGAARGPHVHGRRGGARPASTPRPRPWAPTRWW